MGTFCPHNEGIPEPHTYKLNSTMKMKQNHTLTNPVITTVYYSNVTLEFTGKWVTSRGVSGPVSVFMNTLIKTEGRESLKTITLSRTKGSQRLVQQTHTLTVEQQITNT